MNSPFLIQTKTKIIMKKLFLSLAVIAATVLSTTSLKAADAKDYQVTGPVIEIHDTYIVVKKSEANWQLARNKSTKGGDVKVGAKVTVYYTMIATEIEAKKATAAKSEKKTEMKTDKK